MVALPMRRTVMFVSDLQANRSLAGLAIPCGNVKILRCKIREFCTRKVSRMKYGYARVSTDAQDLEGQLERLKAAGCEKIFHEKLSGKDADRPQFKRLLRALKPGDTMMAVHSDRLARDPFDMLYIFRHAQEVGARLTLLDEPHIDTANEVASYVVDVHAFLSGLSAKLHRLSILRNTSDGRARAKARGVKFGRKPKLSPQQQREALARLAAGEPLRQVARAFSVSGSTIGRVASRAGS